MKEQKLAYRIVLSLLGISLIGFLIAASTTDFKSGVKLPSETANRVLTLDGAGKITSSDVTDTNFSYYDISSSLTGLLNTKFNTDSILAHEYGGLETDVSAFDGLIKISGGSTSYVAAPSGSVVGDSDVQALTNKTIDGSNNTISNIDLATQVTGNLPVGNFNSGTGADSTTFWRGDGTWATPSGSGVSELNDLSDVTLTSPVQGHILYHNGSAWVNLAYGTSGQFLKTQGSGANPVWDTPAGSGDVSKVGTPVDNQIGVWTGDGTIEGTSNFTYDGSNLLLTGDIGATGTRITKGWFTDLTVTNTISGSISGNAATVSTITGLAPDTATTQATQPNITSAANLATVGTVTAGTWNADTIAIANGGTGQTTASGAINALLPTQTGNSGKYLTTDGSSASWGTVAGTGDVTGPGSSTDNAVAKFDSTTGKIIQNSGVTIDDSNNITTLGTISVAADADSTIVTGRGKLGYNSSDIDLFCIGHFDYFNSTDYAFAQDNSGNTYINAPTGANLFFGINNSTKATIDSNGNLGVAVTPNASYRAYIRGSGNSSSTYCLVLDNSSSNDILRIRDDGNCYVRSSLGIGTTASNIFDAYQASGETKGTLGCASLSDGQTNYFEVFGNKGGGSTRYARIGVRYNSGSTSDQACGYIYLNPSDGSANFLFLDDSDILRITSTSTNVGTTTGTVVGDQTSDIRLKNIDGKCPYGLKEILRLNPVKFKFKSDLEHEHIGFIAQEARKIISESVYNTGDFVLDDSGDWVELQKEKRDKDGKIIQKRIVKKGKLDKLAMRYYELIPVLVRAIQEQQAKIEFNRMLIYCLIGYSIILTIYLMRRRK